ncbi:hypothetical protein ACHAPT_009398 [Fusarium lateritium]
MVDLLLAAGADVQATEDSGWTALHWAARYDETQIMERLLSAGARVDARNVFYGETPLHFAAKYGCLQAARLLLNRGADIDAMARDGDSPLLTAMSHRSYRAVALLLELGADYLHQGLNGSVLHYAALFGNEKTFRTLASFELKGLDINAVNRLGRTASEFFEFRAVISDDTRLDDTRLAFRRLLDVVNRNQLDHDVCEEPSDPDEAFVDAAEFLDDQGTQS